MIKLDHSGWARKLMQRAVRSRRTVGRRNAVPASFSTEGLEERCLLTPLIVDDSVDLLENSPDGTDVYDVNDSNTGGDFDDDLDILTYSIISGNDLGAFAIAAGTGQITVADFTILDFETNPQFNLLVEATDGIEAPSQATITINLTNLDEDLSIADAFLIDGNETPILSPLIGEMIGVQTNYVTHNLPDPVDYRIGYTLDGVPIDTEGLDNGAGVHNQAPEQWIDIVEGWYATPGTHTLEITIDADNVIREDDETNNTVTIVFTTSTASPPVQFGWPVDGDPQTDHYITAYVDVDPTTDDNTRDDESDYTGGFHTVDQTTGWHISPPTSKDQDLGIPVYASADGVVAAINDGEFDRENQPLDPLPDPIPDSNFITIDHGDGYASTYSRLRKDSIWLRPGDPVVEGQLIGLVGSSGPFAFEAALHWEVSRYGRPIETLIDPNVYLQSAPDYSGSFSFIRRSFFSQCLPTHPFNPCPNPTSFEDWIPYDFTAHIAEGPSEVETFPVTGDQPVAVFVEFGTIRTGDTIEAVWLRPDGTEYARDQAVAGREDYSAEFWWERFLPEEPIQGEWTVQFFQNGAQVGEDSFSVQVEELPEMRVERQSLFFPARLDFPEDIYVDERFTPVDLDQPGGGEFGATTDETWTIHNQGTADLVIDEIVVPEAFQFDVFDKLGFLITDFPGAASYGGGSGTLTTQPGAATYILVQPIPGLAPGYYSGMVRMFSNDPDELDYNVSIESRVGGGLQPALEIGVASRDIFEDPVSGDLRTRLVANVRRVNDSATSIMDEVIVDLIAEVSDVTFPGNVRIPPGEDYASFYIETINDNKIEGTEYLRIGARDRDTVAPYTPAFTTIRIVDDDVAAITVVETDGSTIVDENGSTDSFSVTLDSEPITNVVIDVATDDPGEATASPARLTYTPLNWNVPQTVTVTGVNDDATDGDIDSNVVLSINDFLSDNDFDPMEDVLVPLTTIDNDTPGFLITESGGDTTVDESGTVDTFNVRLTRAPLSNVILDLSAGDLGEAAVNVGSLIFTPATWDIDQTVTVSGIDDDVVDGSISSSITVGVRPLGSDPDWASVGDQTITATTTDDEVAGLAIDALDTLIVSESGTTATFEVALTDLPLSDVRIQLVPTDATEVTVSPSTLRFRPTNGTTSQTVTITGLDDTFVDGNVASQILVSVIDQQSNNFFDGLSETVDVETVDDDSEGVTIVASGAGTSVSETGTTDTFEVVLSAEPQSNVVVDLTSDDTTEFTLDTASITFTPTNWADPVTVTVTGVDDSDVDGDITAEVQFAIDTLQSDPLYHGVVVTPLPVVNEDDEPAEIIVAETGGSTSVSETGTSDSFDVTLTGPPLSPVVIEVLSNDLTEVSFSPATLTFTSANFNIPQTVTVTGEDDSVVDGSITSQISVRVVNAESHPAFHPATDQLVTVVTSDDEVAGVQITETGGSTIVSETGTTDTFDIALTGEPLSDVVIDVTYPDATEGMVSPSRLTFTPANWADNQTVTVTGLDDDFADGDISVAIVVAVDDSASTGGFAAVPDQVVNATTTDDDVAGFVVAETGSHTLTREGGNTDDVDVMLTAAPTSPVVIDISSRNAAEVGVIPASVTFDSSNWNVPQSVTFNAVDDGTRDGKRSTIADFAVAATSNAMFLGLSDTLTVITIDNDSPIYLDDTQLIVDATILDDTITLEQSGITITATLNSDTLAFTTDAYESVFVKAKSGNDTIAATSVTAPVRVLGGGGNDLIEVGSGDDTVRGGGGLDTLIGNDGHDLLSGGNKRDWIEGGRGLDSIQGGRGADSLVGGDGSDSIQGQNGRDTVIGGAGSDTLSGNNGPDSILGESGADFITGGGGDDIVSAGSGMDTILGGSGKDLLNGEEDGDLIIGGSANDTVNGNGGRDVLFGGTDLDIVNGHDGEDILGAGRVNLSSAEMGSILDEWNSARTYQQRVDNIHNGPTKTNDRLNTAFLIGPNRPPSPQTAFDDEDRDELTGAGGNDFFFANIDNRDELDNALTEWVDLI